MEDQQLQDEIQTDLNHMEEMVRSTLDFMKGTESKEQRQRMDLQALLESMQEDLHPLGIRFGLQGEINTHCQCAAPRHQTLSDQPAGECSSLWNGRD